MTEFLIARIVLAVLLIGTGVLLLWLARATVSGRVRRNQVAGIRTPTTLASDEAWLAAHRRAEGPTRAGGFASILSGLGVLVPVEEWAVAVIIGVGSLVMLGFVLYGAKVGTDAAREVGSPR